MKARTALRWMIPVCVLAGGLLLLLLISLQVTAAAPDAPGAQISLFNAPSPPTAIRPGEAELFHWEIVASTTPVSVSFKLINVDTGALIESQVYPGASGLDVSRSYILPAGYTLPFGKLFERYRVRIEYYSLQAGNESNAEAIFWVTQDTGNLQVVKFNDLNGDGERDPGDGPVPGVVFTLNIQGQQVGGVTDAAGQIFWSDVPVGNYLVSEQTPAGSVPTTPAQVNVPVTANTTTVQEFGNRTIPGALEALVFVDHDGNGSQDPGDLPFVGATVNFLTPACSEMQSGVTGAAGTVTWPDRCVGEYVVWLDVPFGYLATTPDTVTTTVSSGITSLVEFGIQGQGGLIACKFNDRNGNGAQDVGEGPMAGVALSWLNDLGGTGSSVTGQDGCVAWQDLPAATYAVTETPPPGCMPTTEPYPPQVILPPGQSRFVDIGNRCFGALEARTFEDLDDNGTWDPGEAPLGGVAVSWSNEYGEGDSDVTDATGILTWPSEPEGAYTVTASILPGFAPTTPSTQTGAVLTAQTTTFDFGQRPRVGRLYLPLLLKQVSQVTPTPTADPATVTPVGAGCVTGRKIDTTLTGLPGWTINLQPAAGSTVRSTITDGLGQFRFDGVPAGRYMVSEVLQSGWTPVFPPSVIIVVSAGDQCTSVTFQNRQATPTPTATPTSTPRPIVPNIPHPKGIGVNVQTNRIYVASKTSDRLVKIDGATNAVLASYPTGDEPFGVAVNSNSGKVYVANYAGDSLWVLDGASGALLGTVSFSSLGYGEPAFVAVNETLNRTYVTLHDGGRLAVINGATNALITTVEAEAGALGVAVDPGLQRAFVACRDTGNVVVIDTTSNTRLWGQTFPVQGEPYAIAVDAVRHRLYALISEGGGDPDRVAVFSLAPSGASRIGTVMVGAGGVDGGTGIAVNTTTGHVFVANSAAATVTVIDGPGMVVLNTLAVGDDPGMVGVNPATNLVYVGNRGSNSVQVLQDSFTRRPRR